MGLLPVTLNQLSNSNSSNELKVLDYGSKWRSLCQPKYVTCAAVVVGLLLVFTTVLVSDESNMNKSFFDIASGSFKIRTQAERLSGNATGERLSSAEEACHGRQRGQELPRGIVVPTTDLQVRSLYNEDEKEVQKAMPKNLLAMAVGIKQKNDVNDIVHKFPLNNFTIMLFHYDGVVDQWQDLPWSNQSIHIVALHQTKWWFAKRFMHPDIVDQYNYIFLWDEDLGVEHFDAQRYLEIMEAEGLEISQPALDYKSEVHHRITLRHPRVNAHKSVHSKSCPPENKGVPCAGYVEVMAPVFSKAAWQCVWHMVQNDLVHGWGVDFKIGYCAQGLRSEKVGVIDAEYVLHKAIPSLGGPHVNNTLLAEHNSTTKVFDARHEVRARSGKEMLEFQARWAQAVQDDPTWKDPYEEYAKQEMWQARKRAPSVPPH
jgi:hypothetical protein